MDTTNVINLYEKLLDLETSNHNTFIIVLLGIIVLLMGITWWWNRVGVLNEIKKEISSQFNEELKDFKKYIKKQIQKDVKKEIQKYKNKMIAIQGENARAMAIICSESGKFSYSITWWARALKYAIDSNSDGSLIRMIVDAISTTLKNLKKHDSKDGKKKATVYQYDFIMEVVEMIPDTLNNEKKQIINKLDGRKDLDEDE